MEAARHLAQLGDALGERGVGRALHLALGLQDLQRLQGVLQELRRRPVKRLDSSIGLLNELCFNLEMQEA